MLLVGAGSLVVVVGGTLLSYAVRANARPLDAAAYVLLTAGAVSVAFGLWQPVPALVVALAVTSIYYSLDYDRASPLFLAVIVLLFVGALAHRVRRSLLIALLAVGTVVVQHLATEGPAGLTTGLVANIGWIAAAVLAGHALAAQRDYVAAMRDRAQRAEESRELEAERRVTEERLRIARELHDVVSHTISVINVQAGVAAHVIEQRPEQAAVALETIRDASKEALRELRGILNVLRQTDDDPIRPAPGLSDLDALVSATRHAGLVVTMTTSGVPTRVSPTVELAAYRIVQESLTNALRYTRDGAAQVKLAYEVDRLQVEVCDTGRAVVQSASGSGHGIQGMRERAAAVGGTLEVGPRTGGGFRVHATLPAQT